MTTLKTILTGLLLLPAVVLAVSRNSPESYPLMTYLWVIMTAIGGGLASLAGRIRKVTILEIGGELIVSAFAGVMTFWLCEYAEIGQLASAALVGIVGHMGSRGMVALEKIGIKLLGGKFKLTVEGHDDDSEDGSGKTDKEV